MAPIQTYSVTVTVEVGSGPRVRPDRAPGGGPPLGASAVPAPSGLFTEEPVRVGHEVAVEPVVRRLLVGGLDDRALSQSEHLRPGTAMIIGEWVAMTNWACPRRRYSESRRSSSSWLAGDSAASGSSRKYSPGIW